MKRVLLFLPFALVACDGSMTAPTAKPSLAITSAGGRNAAAAFSLAFPCTPTGFIRDGIDLTAAVNNPVTPVTGAVDASGCDIGVYYGPGTTGSVNAAAISGARYFGVVNNAATVDVTNSSIANTGDSPFDGAQHGVAIFYTTENPAGTPAGSAGGTISGNTVSSYQKGGITVRGAGATASILNNIVTGLGPVDFIAQNGIQVSFDGSGVVRGNSVSGNDYTPAGTTSCGILLFSAGGAKVQDNKYRDNEANMCNFVKGGGNVSF
jgi:parallel beta-helix repeat protein